MAGEESLFNQALAAAQQRDFASARILIKQLIKQEPYNVNAWLLGARVVETEADAIRCYERILQIDPSHAYAKQKLAELRTANPAIPVAPSAPASTSPSNKVVPFQPIPIQATPIEPLTTDSIQLTQTNNEAKTRSQVTIALIGIVVGICCLAVLTIVMLPHLGFSQVAQSTPTNQELFNVLYHNARAANKEDVDDYMSTIHPSSPAAFTTRAALVLLFSQYDLSFQFYDVRVISVNADEAKVHFSLQTSKISGPDFRDNVITGTMTLKPDNGVWKIYDQEVENTQYK